MKLASTIVAVTILTLALSACQTTTMSYTPLGENVRVANSYEDKEKTKLIGTRIEMRHSVQTNKWFEAEKTTSGNYEFTAKGTSDAKAFVDSCAGSCNIPADCK